MIRIVEIIVQTNGAHNNVTWEMPGVLPDGWAVVPEGMVCENFPFGEVEAADVNGVITVTKWTPGVVLETYHESENME